ncbi:Single-stranded-DNA-specific exonuclease RecJ, partial [hydrothermal vent metagenome]
MAADRQFFLDVKQSIRGQAWVPRLEQTRDALAISQRYGLSEIVGRILAGRGVGLDEVDVWLDPTLRELMPAPETVVDLVKGAGRIVDAICAGEQIAVLGDYDVDGISSTSILLGFLTSAGATPLAHIPDRVKEGYGPSIFAVEKLHGEGTRVLVTLDCGTASHVPLARAKELGLDVVVVDHHQVPEDLPETFALINPNRNDDLSGLGNLCAAGV